MDELNYIVRAKSGDLKAFEKLVELYHKRVFSFAYVRVRNREDASDIVQDVFWKLFSNIKKYDENRSFFSWLFTIEINVIRDFVRRKKKIKEVVSEDFFENTTFYDKGLLSMDDKILLFEALKHLKEDEKDLILLKYVEGMSLKEIGEVLGITEENAKIRVFRAKEKLKKIIMKNAFPLPDLEPIEAAN